MGLTQREVDALPDGSPVVVTWSGGNGPHRYVLRRGIVYRGGTVAEAHTEYVHVGDLDMVGEKPLTTVELAEPCKDAKP